MQIDLPSLMVLLLWSTENWVKYICMEHWKLSEDDEMWIAFQYSKRIHYKLSYVICILYPHSDLNGPESWSTNDDISTKPLVTWDWYSIINTVHTSTDTWHLLPKIASIDNK